MKIYITGIYGMLGWACERILKKDHKIYGCDIVKNPYNKIDITKNELIEKDILKIKPDIILHCAGIIDVQECERYKELSYKVNVDATKNIVNISKENDIKLIYISSPMIFDGIEEIYNESEKVKPINEYGRQKLLCENYIKENLKNYLILRVNIIGWNVQKSKINFAEWMQNALLEGKEIELWDNVYYNYLFTEDLAKIINQIMDKNGLYHLGSSDYLSKYELCLYFAKIFGYATLHIKKGFSNEKRKLILVSNLLKEIKMPSIFETMKELKTNLNYYRN
jgi:dTDP-4-dehydrorhamnose reductase